jgi:hypothetical protein
MSNPQSITQLRLGQVVESAPKLHVLQGGDRLIEASGSKGAFVAGGPVLEGAQLKNFNVTLPATLSAAQVVGGLVQFADNATPGVWRFTLPSAAALFEYLSLQYFKADGDAGDIVGGIQPSANPSIPLSSFECSFTTGSGTPPGLDLGAGIEYYPTGSANAADAGPIVLFASSVATLRFICIDTNPAAPRIGVIPVVNPNPNPNPPPAPSYGIARIGGPQTLATGVTTPANLDNVGADSGGVVDLALNRMNLLNDSIYSVHATLGYGLLAPATGGGPANNRIILLNNGAPATVCIDQEKLLPGDPGGQCSLSVIVRTGSTGPQHVFLEITSVPPWAQTMQVDSYDLSVSRIGPA